MAGAGAGAGAPSNPGAVDAVIDFARAGLWSKVQRALDAGFPVQSRHSVTKTTLLHFACTPAAADALLRRGAALDALDLAGGTPLVAAVSRGDALVVKALLQAGADPNLRGRGNTPLQVAAVHTKPLSAAEDCVRALLAAPGTALDAQFKGYTAEERARTMPQRAFLADLIGEEVCGLRCWCCWCC